MEKSLAHPRALSSFQINDGLGWTRTSGLLLRRQSLYPPELQAHFQITIGILTARTHRSQPTGHTLSKNPYSLSQNGYESGHGRTNMARERTDFIVERNGKLYLRIGYTDSSGKSR